LTAVLKTACRPGKNSSVNFDVRLPNSLFCSVQFSRDF
jgi:hypothetical protein